MATILLGLLLRATALNINPIVLQIVVSSLCTRRFNVDEHTSQSHRFRVLAVAAAVSVAMLQKEERESVY